MEKEIDMQRSRKAQKVTSKTHPRHIIIKLSKVNENENLKSSKRKTTCNVQGNHHMTLISRFFSRNFRGTIYSKKKSSKQV